MLCFSFPGVPCVVARYRTIDAQVIYVLKTLHPLVVVFLLTRQIRRGGRLTLPLGPGKSRGGVIVCVSLMAVTPSMVVPEGVPTRDGDLFQSPEVIADYLGPGIESGPLAGSR